MKRVLFLLSFIFVFQFLFLPNAEAVSPWEGTPWQGTPWEGSPWKGIPWDGHPWDGNQGDNGPGSDEMPTDDKDSETGDGSVGDDSFDDKGTVGSGAEANANEPDIDNLCLPIPANDWGDITPRNSSTVTDDERKEMIIKATEKLVKNNPTMYYVIAKDPEAYVEKAEEAFDQLLDRPHGTINDIDIPSDVLANMANMGYSDAKVGEMERKEVERDLLDNGWVETEAREHWTGFEGRAYINREDGTIAFSFGGTEHKRDWIADGKVATGRHTGQYDQAEKFVEEMMKRYPDFQPVLVGHSLGGAVAQKVSLNTHIPAITFNAPGIGTREFGFMDFLKDGGDAIAAILKTAINEGSLNPFVDQVNQNRLFDDLMTNHVMEGDEIGTYQIHLGQTNIYTDDGDVEIKYDYSDEAHASDLPVTKAGKTIFDLGIDKGPYHGMDNFIDIMEDCY